MGVKASCLQDQSEAQPPSGADEGRLARPASPSSQCHRGCRSSCASGEMVMAGQIGSALGTLLCKPMCKGTCFPSQCSRATKLRLRVGNSESLIMTLTSPVRLLVIMKYWILYRTLLRCAVIVGICPSPSLLRLIAGATCVQYLPMYVPFFTSFNSVEGLRGMNPFRFRRMGGYTTVTEQWLRNLCGWVYLHTRCR